MARIFVLYTGGTFGGMETSDGVAPAGVEQILPLLPKTPATVSVEGFGRIVDSSSIQPSDWVEMAQIIRARYEDYDGFVILHGTDSMAYTSSALSHLIQGLQKPVVLTGSQIPLSFAENDASQNYQDAVAFAGNGKPGVWIVFGGIDVPGDQAVKVSCERLQAFDSPKGRQAPTPDRRPFHVQTDIEPNVRLLFCHPGLSASELAEEILRPCKGLVIASYGVGNLPNDPAIEAALSKAIHEHGKRIVQVTQCAHGSVDAGFYVAGGAMVRTGVEAGGNQTVEAAVTRLMVELAQ